MSKTAHATTRKRTLAVAALLTGGLAVTGCSGVTDAVAGLVPGADTSVVKESPVEGYWLTNGEKVTDDRGSYSRLPTEIWEGSGDKAGPNSTPWKTAAEGLFVQSETEITEAGYTRDDVVEGMRLAEAFAYTAVWDSSIFDVAVTAEEYQDWYEEEIEPVLPIHPLIVEQMRDVSTEEIPKGVGSEAGGTIVPLVRDDMKRYLIPGEDVGEVQASDALKVESIVVASGEEGVWLDYPFSLDLVLRVEVPEGEPEQVIPVSGTTTVKVFKDDGELYIAGLQHDIDME